MITYSEQLEQIIKDTEKLLLALRTTLIRSKREEEAGRLQSTT